MNKHRQYWRWLYTISMVRWSYKHVQQATSWQDTTYLNHVLVPWSTDSASSAASVFFFLIFTPTHAQTQPRYAFDTIIHYMIAMHNFQVTDRTRVNAILDIQIMPLTWLAYWQHGGLSSLRVYQQPDAIRPSARERVRECTVGPDT